VERRSVRISLPCTGDEEWQATREPLLSGWLTQGPKVAAFEKAFAARHQVKYALATSSCTTALHAILAAIGIGPGDEVIVPAFTWIATANVVVYCGATPVFVDVDRRTYNLDVADISRRLSPRTKAVIAVHLFGLGADVAGLRRVLPPGVKLIEDAACAAGGAIGARPAGSLGDAAAFSFHPRKSITTGEGGMVTTNDAALATMVDMLRNHGASIPEEQRDVSQEPYLLPNFNLLGFNYRMTDLQGAVGVVQLSKLDRFIAERQRWAEFYRGELADIPWLVMPEPPSEGQHAWQAFVTYVRPEIAPRPRNEIMKLLHAKGIATRPGTHAVHMLGYYQDRFGCRPEHYPAARDCEAQTMAIPLHNRMTSDDYKHVVRSLHDID
jgi:perosamine synthetase